jgi:uncharacterized protein (DUF362 family)
MSTKKCLSRREFIATSAKAGALVATGLGLSCGRGEVAPPPDLVSAHGPDAVANTRAVIDAMGGMKAFVQPGQVVNILPNAQGSHPGCSTNPDVVRTVVELCREAGASDVRWMTWISGKYWERSRIADFVDASGASLVQVDADDESRWKMMEVANGLTLERVRVFDVLWDSDVFISVPLFKDHIGSNFTGVLKNYMGTSHPTDNRAFHPTWEGEDVVRMERCVADLNTVVRAPDLIVADATVCLTSDGPFGPGDIARPERVVATTDRLIDRDGPSVTMIRKAHEHGLGEIDLAKLNVVELEIG